METYLVLDPGETTGWALFNFQGKPIQMGGVEYGAELFDFLQEMVPNFYVVEEYMLRTARVGRQQGIKYTKEWDKVITARAIGAIEARARELRREVIFQQPSIKSATAPKYGLPLTGLRSAQHPIDAIIHGYYYAEKRLGIPPPYNPVPVTPVKVEPVRIVQINDYSELKRAMKKRKG